MSDSIVHLRIPAATKARWVRESRAAGMKLTDWIIKRVEEGASTMSIINTKTEFEVSANGQVFGTYEAADDQNARDLCAQDAGYKSEAEMVAQLECPSELVATEVSPD